MYPVLFSVQGFKVHSSPVFLVLGIVAGVYVGWLEIRRLEIPGKQFGLFIAIGVPLAILISALNSWLFYAWGNLNRVLSSGMISFGAILAILLWGFLLGKMSKSKRPIGLTLDTIVLALPLVLAVYRIGCFLNGCCFGLETEGMLGMYLPDTDNNWAYRYPTQLMLMVFNIGLFIWLWTHRKKKTFHGSLAITFLLVYLSGRLIIDAFRDLPRILGPFSLHQLSSMVLLFAVLYFIFELKISRRSSPNLSVK